MTIFRDPTLALSAALFSLLALLAGIAMLVGEAPAAQADVPSHGTAVHEYRSVAGSALRLGATADPQLHAIGARLAEIGAAGAVDSSGDLAAAWADATAAGRTLATVDLSSRDATYSAVITALSAGDVLSQVLAGGSYRPVTPAAGLDTGDPSLRRPAVTVPGVGTPATPPRPRVDAPAPTTPRLPADAPSAPLPTNAVPAAPAVARS